MRVRIAVCAALLLLAGAGPAWAQMVSAETEEIKWGVNPVIPNAKFAVLHGNPAQPGPFVYRVWLPANGAIPAHRHPVAENVTVLWGTLYAGMGEKLDRDKSKAYRACGYFSMPADHPHEGGDADPGPRRGTDVDHVRRSRRRPPEEVSRATRAAAGERSAPARAAITSLRPGP